MTLPPGTLLQRMYLRERLRPLLAGEFLEVGTGEGWLAKTLLDAGWRGTGYETSALAARRARATLEAEVVAGRFRIEERDWLNVDLVERQVDLVVSAMVLEHLASADERRYFEQAARHLRPGGFAILLVPGSPAHWGIEDEVAGHYRRYTADGMLTLLRGMGWHAYHVAGLTFPLSNFLLPLSNRLVRRSESEKQTLSREQRTARSGHRVVPFKTRFPALFRLVLNEIVLYPWHLAQKAARTRPEALVLYVECGPTSSARPVPVTSGHSFERG